MPCPAHLQDGAVRPCQTDTIQAARRGRAQTVLWALSFAVLGKHCATYQVMNSKVGDGVPYPTTWATKLGSTRTPSPFLSLTCKAIPFIYERGCTLS